MVPGAPPLGAFCQALMLKMCGIYHAKPTAGVELVVVLNCSCTVYFNEQTLCLAEPIL